MAVQTFYLLGNPVTSAKQIEIESNIGLDGLKHLIAAHFAIVEPNGIAFQFEDAELADVPDITFAQGSVTITIDGHAVRDRRLFERFGPVIQTNNMGRVTYQTNDPNIAAIACVESHFFTKEINKAHPLYALKTPSAGVFLGDTDTPEWRVAHKFILPALDPKAVRHYAPTMQKTVKDACKVFDKLDEQGEAWNVYQYMLKLGAQAVGKLTLGLDFEHFTSPDAPVHEMVHLIAELLSLNKKVTSKGNWYSSLPFGDNKRLKEVKSRIEGMVEQSIQNAARGGADDLPLQDAALQASNMADCAIRATDNKGEKLPKESLIWALVVATVTYQGMQERLLQELIDNNFDNQTEITADFTNRLVFQDKYIKEMQRRHNPFFPTWADRKDRPYPSWGYRIPKDAVIIPAIHHIHNNPELWDNPYKFDPDRWDTSEVKNRHKASYVPFGAGPRMCIGFKFALQEIILPKLIYNYKFVREGDGPIEYDPIFQLIHPNNLDVRAHKRVKCPPPTTKKTEAAV
ncbi:hypothetical protein N7444_011499 [Penicillium canescens]|nr:hypothetical protein N7444_011499 [Penicillium canescens]